MIKIPVASKIIPPTFETILIFFLKFFENTKNFCIKKPDNINGIAKPKEYKLSNIIAFEIFSSVDAKARIDPKIGPIHGVHPNPKAMPTTKINEGLVDLPV